MSIFCRNWSFGRGCIKEGRSFPAKFEFKRYRVPSNPRRFPDLQSATYAVIMADTILVVGHRWISTSFVDVELE